MGGGGGGATRAVRFGVRIGGGGGAITSSSGSIEIIGRSSSTAGAGTTFTCWHAGHRARLPADVSGAFKLLPHLQFQRMLTMRPNETSVNPGPVQRWI